ncbi:MAG: mannose-1-phosphate guanylyltransferase [Haloferacaceae archaeon]
MDRPLVAVVLAGGVGSRLYPASRGDRPKQFLALDGDRSLLTRTVERAAFADHVLVVTREAYAEQAREHVDAAVGSATVTDGTDADGDATPAEVVVEPAGRDTGPALLYATHEARRRVADPVVLALPSDHHVAGEFAAVGRLAARAAVDADALATVGVEPTRPETGYGYVEPGGERTLPDGEGTYREVAAFHEKPDAETAAEYVRAGHLWNAGIFAWTPAALFREAADSPLAPLVAALEGEDPTRGFEQIEPVSIDYAVMERADSVVVVRGTFEWDDLGAWDSLARVLASDADSNVALGEALTVDAADNVVASDGKHVSLVGVEGLAVVAWDDRVLVVPKDRAQRVREVVAELRSEGRF